MAVVHVYNTGVNPVIYDDGKTIGGLEWHSVEQELVQEYLDAGILITKQNRVEPSAIIPEPVLEAPAEIPSESPETVAADNSEAVETNVVSETEEVPAEVVESGEVSTVDAPPETPSPATMRKTRQRKTAKPEKE